MRASDGRRGGERGPLAAEVGPTCRTVGQVDGDHLVADPDSCCTCGVDSAMTFHCSLTTFDLQDMLRCGREIRKAASGAASLEQAAQRVCRLLYDSLSDEANARDCVLVRCYKTHAFGNLPDDLRAFVQNAY